MVVLFWLTVLASGCRDRVPRPEPVDPVSMAEAEALARRFEAAMAPCSAAELDALTDRETMLRRAVAKADAPARAKREFLEGARSGMSMGAMLCQGKTDDHVVVSFELLRVREVDGQPRPLFRTLVADTIDYQELQLGKSRADHQVRVVDLHSYTTGELASDTFANMLETSVASARQGDDVGAAADILGEITAARARGDLEEVRRLLGRLPPTMRDMKALRLIELMAAAELDEASYADLIARYQRSFPGDPSLDMVALDGYYLRQNGPAMLATIERLDQRVGGDPYLGLLRASALMLEPTPEHLVEAERWAKSATDAIPTLENGWWILGTVRLLRDDHAGVVTVFDKLEGEFGADFDLDAMRGAEAYASFLRSPEFAAWWAKRG